MYLSICDKQTKGHYYIFWPSIIYRHILNLKSGDQAQKGS